MKQVLTSVLVAALIATQASAITFPQVTTIYVGLGVSGGGSNSDFTVVQCSNVSGQTASVRFLALNYVGNTTGDHVASLPHGGTFTLGLGLSNNYAEDWVLAVESAPGSIIVESTQSGVFCNANVLIEDENDFVQLVRPIPLVRINGHPGTIE